MIRLGIGGEPCGIGFPGFAALQDLVHNRPVLIGGNLVGAVESAPHHDRHPAPTRHFFAAPVGHHRLGRRSLEPELKRSGFVERDQFLDQLDAQHDLARLDEKPLHGITAISLVAPDVIAEPSKAALFSPQPNVGCKIPLLLLILQPPMHELPGLPDLITFRRFSSERLDLEARRSPRLIDPCDLSAARHGARIIVSHRTHADHVAERGLRFFHCDFDPHAPDLDRLLRWRKRPRHLRAAILFDRNFRFEISDFRLRLASELREVRIECLPVYGNRRPTDLRAILGLGDQFHRCGQQFAAFAYHTVEEPECIHRVAPIHNGDIVALHLDRREGRIDLVLETIRAVFPLEVRPAKGLRCCEFFAVELIFHTIVTSGQIRYLDHAASAPLGIERDGAGGNSCYFLERLFPDRSVVEWHLLKQFGGNCRGKHTDFQFTRTPEWRLLIG